MTTSSGVHGWDLAPAIPAEGSDVFQMARRPRPHHGPCSGGQALRRLLNRTTKTMTAANFDRGRLLPTALPTAGLMVLPRGQEAHPCHPPPLPPQR